MSIILAPEERAKYMLVAAGAAMACNELPTTEVNEDAKELIAKYMKRLAPRTVNAKGDINFDRVRNEVNNCFKSSELKYFKTLQYDADQFRQNALRKVDTRVVMDLYANKIDSRFANKFYVPSTNQMSKTSTIDTIATAISNIDMEKIMEVRGEEMVVDMTQTRQQQEIKEMMEEVFITGSEFDQTFIKNAVEIGGEEPKQVEETVQEVTEVATPKVEQQVPESPKGVHAETMEVADDTWKANLPVEQKQKGFLGNLFEKLKSGIKTVKDKIFGASENNNTTTGTADNNATTTGTGGVNKDEQNVEALTGHGKIKLEFGTSASQTVGTESKGKDSKSDGEPEHDEEVL